MGSDEEQLRRLMEEWRRYTAAGDLDGLLPLISDHAVFLTPGKSPITKTDFRLAYAWSHLTVVLTAKAGGARSESSGHVLTVFRKSADGVWQLARDANLIAGAGNPDRM